MKKIRLLLLFITISGWVNAQITEIGQASFYADKFDGRITASGEIFDQSKLTAAHRTLPFGSKLKVTNLENNKSVVVTVNDRGPFVNDRIIDISKSAADKIDFAGKGVVKVKIEVIYIPDDTTQAKTYTPPTQAKSDSKQSLVTPVSSSETIASQAIEYYKVESSEITPSGFGIQVASYKEAANLMKRCSDIRKTTGKDIFVQVGDNNGEKIYRIMLGSFETKEQAVKFNERLQSEFKGSFVVAF